MVRKMTPGQSGAPSMVKVLPAPVAPYANTMYESEKGFQNTSNKGVWAQIRSRLLSWRQISSVCWKYLGVNKQQKIT